MEWWLLRGAAQLVFGLASNSVISGNQYIQIGGSADGTTIKAGGDQDILGGGIATNTTVDGGTQTVFGVAIQATVANGGLQHVHNNAFNTVVNAGGQQSVYADGTATGTTINAGGVQVDWGAPTPPSSTAACNMCMAAQPVQRSCPARSTCRPVAALMTPRSARARSPLSMRAARSTM